jgi:hypothetical protein
VPNAPYQTRGSLLPGAIEFSFDLILFFRLSFFLLTYLHTHVFGAGMIFDTRVTEIKRGLRLNCIKGRRRRRRRRMYNYDGPIEEACGLPSTELY